ncbi:DUF2842 domain-containing protein [Frigidibacter sp. ROC022]|uniref:DUF2842 domain-containing protein n=1 Tax=Frigidibacter sp. ROC022 TaxID=2971796 RepID=UPI00215AF8D1|nr:DUF2842 domain-containing protein [Frigidibacter sp. ROC022]MCR8725279.1 DUF2842 domain-containing protein [Frigidibacter sp. ROC022]
MALRWRTRRRLSLLVLVVGLPVYILLAMKLVSVLAPTDRPAILVELAIYVGLGLLWLLPCRPLFRGIGQPEPEDERLARQRR